MTITPDMAKDLRGSMVYDAHDQKLGKVGEVYVDNSSGMPKWVTVNTGMLGTKETFVPLDGARTSEDGLRVATDKKTVSDAPHTGQSAGELSESEERRLHSHYGMTDAGAADATQRGQADQRGRSGRDAGRADDRTDDRQGGDRQGDQAMSRSEERLAVGTESVETGQVRLRKYVVTETERVEVPVRREEVRIEREQVSGDRPARGSIGDDERSVTLHAERPVVSKEAHEVERVRLDTRTVTENASVSDDVRKERIDVDDPSGVAQSGHGDRKDKNGKSSKNS